MLAIVFQGDNGGGCQAPSQASFAPTDTEDARGAGKQAIKNPEGEPSGFFVWLRFSG
ncbi:hypothetical protein [Pseudomonas chlororaphis]|uniref:hypothetical protein n=1 Tax=Pseudomonas chlororaphis TaxID=587753 RepID=UPI000A4403C6|nr:hypothetical protein [Pseudomonas chlororaphis]MBM0283990.1 hypothetical protein [Pseudomonas chlororaphis]MDO1505559.1 hypothetical protein [Pseudomonas chlororaphis]WDG99587.1 hypothetical protein PUP54_08415 [Pseudomonas chlororaphis]WDH18593.1 hypothetical protein PUP70_10915 [Pseudomonas chlororaphis]WDH66666.1 hypothetical protein PUP71_08165 [Pseudomonas chlororaphis]